MFPSSVWHPTYDDVDPTPKKEKEKEDAEWHYHDTGTLPLALVVPQTLLGPMKTLGRVGHGTLQGLVQCGVLDRVCSNRRVYVGCSFSAPPYYPW